MRLITKITCMVLILSGCASIKFQSDLVAFQDRVWDKTQPEFQTIIKLLQKNHKAANDYLLNNMPEVISVHSKYWARGFCVLVYQYRSGMCHGHVFCSDGSDFDAAPVEYDDDPVVKTAIRRQLSFVSKRKAKALKKKFEAEELAIADPKKVCLGDLAGVKAMTPIVGYLRDAGIWPDHSYTETDMYNFNFRHEYKDGTVPGLVPVDGFTISGLVVDKKTGGLLEVYMQTHVQIGNIDRFITSQLHTLQAMLHTQKPPQKNNDLISHMPEYRWDYLETSDGRKLSVSLSYSLSMEFHRYNVYLSVSDSVRAQKYWRGVLDSIGTKKNESGGAQVTNDKVKDDSMYELYNRIKNHLVIVQTERNSGSGFVVKDGDRCYLYTNEHIVRKAKNKPKAVTLDGVELSLGVFELAKGRDLVRFEVNNLNHGLGFATGQPDVNKEIVVFGNSDGVGVATALNGRIVGVGPNLIEVSAEFVQGNSGSPVLFSDGSVVGIATFAIDASESENWVKKDTRFNGVRRFALRLNNVEWQKIEWNLYTIITNR